MINDTTSTYTLPTGETVTVDMEDADLLTFRWSNNGIGYAYRALPRPSHKMSYLHREILARIVGRDLVKGECCDHINLNKLDNRRCNLRLATRKQNIQNQPRRVTNRSGYKGVRKYKNCSTYEARITINGQCIYLGSFPTAELAHEAYCAAGRQHFGEFFNSGDVTGIDT